MVLATVVTSLNPHVDYGRKAVVRDAERSSQFGCQRSRMGDWTEATHPLAAGEHREIRCGVADTGADGPVRARPRPSYRDGVLVQFIVEERAVVGDHDQEWQGAEGRRPPAVHNAVAPMRKSPSPRTATASRCVPCSASAAPTAIPGPEPTPPPPS